MKRRTLNIQLTDKEFQKLSEETGVSQYDIQKLYSMGILRDYSLVSLLIRHDFNAVRRKGRYRPAQIVTRLMMFYHVSRTRVLTAIYQQRSTNYYCEDCGKLIPKYEYVRNAGICDDCVAKSIELP